MTNNEEAINELQSAIDLIKQDGKDWLDERDIPILEMAVKALKAQEWVPVKERFPKKDGSYFVSGKWASGKEAVGECEYKVHDGYFSTAWNFDVLAWKPLPESYKGEFIAIYRRCHPHSNHTQGGVSIRQGMRQDMRPHERRTHERNHSFTGTFWLRHRNRHGIRGSHRGMASASR